jgi:hypothetical protein
MVITRPMKKYLSEKAQAIVDKSGFFDAKQTMGFKTDDELKKIISQEYEEVPEGLLPKLLAIGQEKPIRITSAGV